MTDLTDGADQKPLVHIENAEFAIVFERGLVLIGDVIDHPMLGDLPGVITSTVLNQDLAAGIFETRNTIYQLVR